MNAAASPAVETLPASAAPATDPVTDAHRQTYGAGALQPGEIGNVRDAVARPRARQLDHGLDADQLAHYHEHGYVVLRGRFDAAEVTEWQRAADELRARTDLIDPDNLRFDLCECKQTGRNEVWKIDPFVDLSTVFGGVARDRRILDPLSSIYEGREPRLFKDKLIYKPPGGKGNGLHQDYNWWQGFPTSMISVLVAVDPADHENGCTHLLPGWKKGFLHTPGAFDPLPEERVEMDKAVPIVTEPGDIALFHCYVPHFGGPNPSTRWRRQMFITYNDSADGEHYFSHRDHYWWYVTRHRDAEGKRRAYFR